MPDAKANQTGADQASGSRVVHSDESGGWQGIATLPYKRADGSWSGVTRQILAGGPESPSSFELRYFELAADGRSSHERHQHEHAVIVLRGEGEVLLGSTVHPLRAGDFVHVASGDPHQFRNTGAAPLGILCIVDAERDQPTALGADGAPSCSVDGDELSRPR